MIRFLFRALGFLLVAAAFAALVVDGTRSIAGSRPLFYACGDTLAWLGGGRLDGAMRAAVEAPAPARAMAAAVLAAPGWLVAGPLGLAMLLLGRAPARGPGERPRRG